MGTNRLTRVLVAMLLTFLGAGNLLAQQRSPREEWQGSRTDDGWQGQRPTSPSQQSTPFPAPQKPTPSGKQVLEIPSHRQQESLEPPRRQAEIPPPHSRSFRHDAKVKRLVHRSLSPSQ